MKFFIFSLFLITTSLFAASSNEKSNCCYTLRLDEKNKDNCRYTLLLNETDLSISFSGFSCYMKGNEGVIFTSLENAKIPIKLAILPSFSDKPLNIEEASSNMQSRCTEDGGILINGPSLIQAKELLILKQLWQIPSSSCIRDVTIFNLESDQGYYEIAIVAQFLPKDKDRWIAFLIELINQFNDALSTEIRAA